MIERAKKHLTITFKESFIPVLLIVIAVSVGLVYVNFKAVLDSDRVVTIEILDAYSASGMDDVEGVDEDDVVEFSLAKSDDPLYQRAAQAIESQQWGKAESIYTQIIEQQGSSQAYNDLGVLYYNQGAYNKALVQFNLAAETIPVYLNAYLNRGLVFAKLRQYDLAIQNYEQVTTAIPHHYQAHFNMGVALIKTKDYARAVDVLEQATKQAGGQRKAKALYNLGIAYSNLGPDYKEKAKQAYYSAVRIRPDYVEARLALADTADKSAEGRKLALEQINKVLGLKSNYPPAYFRIGLIHSTAGDDKKALEAYIHAIQYNPQYTKARYNLGLLYLNEKRWADARAQFDRIREQEPNNALVHFQLGRSAYGEKDYDTALREYQMALDLKGGQYEKAYLNIGLAYKAKKNYDQAIAAYEKLLELNPQYPEAWYNLGLVYFQTKQYAAAEQALLTATEYNNKYAQAWFNLGLVYTKAKQRDRAIDAYKKALAIKPNYQKAQLNLAVRYAKKDQYEDAIELYRAVLENDPSYASAWLNIGIAYVKTNKFDDAEVALLKALELEPDSVRARRFLAEAFIAKEEHTLAIKLLQEALDRKANSTSLRILLGKAYKSAGKVREAKSELEKALKLEPSNDEIKKELDSIINLG